MVAKYTILFNRSCYLDEFQSYEILSFDFDPSQFAWVKSEPICEGNLIACLSVDGGRGKARKRKSLHISHPSNIKKEVCGLFNLDCIDLKS